ncbi:MAG: hypothetical protein IPF82_07930 [Blastocatellia bacterium]|nr:hypothetical protein [Blastocatellia bacterium]
MAGFEEAIGFLEVSSIARGIEATDAMPEMAAVATVKPGVLVSEVVKPYAREALRKSLMP